MPPTTIIALTTLFSGLLIFVINLPLIYRKVPMNQLYGVRIRAAFKSEQSWYDLNAYGGRQFAAWSWLIVAAGVIGLFVPVEYALPYVWTDVAVTVIAVLIPAFRTYRWSREHCA